MFWKKRKIEKTKQEMLDKLNSLLDKKGAKILKFDYYYKVFGNMIVEIEFNDEVHTFITDRGEIVHNANLICNSSYHIAGKSDTFPKLLEVIEKELF